MPFPYLRRHGGGEVGPSVAGAIIFLIVLAGFPAASACPGPGPGTVKLERDGTHPNELVAVVRLP